MLVFEGTFVWNWTPLRKDRGRITHAFLSLWKVCTSQCPSTYLHHYSRRIFMRLCIVVRMVRFGCLSCFLFGENRIWCIYHLSKMRANPVGVGPVHIPVVVVYQTSNRLWADRGRSSHEPLPKAWVVEVCVSTVITICISAAVGTAATHRLMPDPNTHGKGVVLGVLFDLGSALWVP